MYLFSAILIFLVGVGLVIGGIDWPSPDPAVWHDADDVKIPGNMKLSGIFDDSGKVKCSEIVNDESTDDICNDDVGGEPDSGEVVGWWSRLDGSCSFGGLSTGCGCPLGSTTIKTGERFKYDYEGQIDKSYYWYICVQD